MALRVPGASSLDQFWANLRDGVESITRLTPEALAAAGERPDWVVRDDYVPAAGLLEHMKAFDAGVFGIGPRDAALMDPQHRHFLEVCWEALEHAGYNPTSTGARVGVFGGSGLNSYFSLNLLANPEMMESLGLFLVRHAGNDKDFLTTRVSYHLGLTGPSLNVQTACSTSLVAIHEAAQHLLAHECDMALAGGVTIENPHGRGYIYRQGEVLSPDGHCRAFDDRGAGTVFGSGVGVVVLRRLEDALRDGDTVHAVIRGSAVNNDGSAKVSYLAPSVEGQSEAIREALAMAHVSADTLTYIEAHGTGTHLGDPIEVSALTDAFDLGPSRARTCALGSVKTNIGHLDTAAGVASFIKVVLALTHGELPPSLHYGVPNRHIDFAGSPFFVNDRLRPWTSTDGPRRAGVNSVGVGGTNAHVVLEEAPPVEPTSPARPWSLLVWSGRDEPAADRATERLAGYCHTLDETRLADAAYTLAVGRKGFGARRALVVSSPADAVAAFEGTGANRLRMGTAGDAAPSVVFMLPGGGAQYPGMARTLFDKEPIFRAAFDACVETLPPSLAAGVRSAVVASPLDADMAAALERSAELSLSALFAVEYALASLWRAWGVEPDALIGHSMGEYVAACLAGVFSPADAMSVVALRGRLFDTLPPGAMLSVDRSESELADLLPPDVSVAAVNSPTTTVVSGPRDAVSRAQAILHAHGAECRPLAIAVAAHSAALDPVLDAFRQHLQRLTLAAPQLRYVSNVTGTWVRPEDAVDPEYWVRHLRGTVRFADGLTTVLTEPRLLLEVGPGHQLASLVRQHPSRRDHHHVCTSLRHAKEQDDDQRTVLDALGRAWCVGAPVQWAALFAGEQRRRVAAPTYPFERTEHWIAPAHDRTTSVAAAPSAGLRKLATLDEWFTHLTWVEEAVAPAAQEAGESRPWLVFADRLGLGRAVAQRLKGLGHTTVLVVEGAYFSGSSPRELIINPQSRGDYDRLVAQLAESKLTPGTIVHAWSEIGPRGAQDRLEYFERCQDMGFRSLLYMLQACATAGVDDLRVFAVGTGFEAVGGRPGSSPEKATLLGLSTVAPIEMPSVRLGTIDLGRSSGEWGGPPPATLMDVLVREMVDRDPAPRVAFRDGRRFVAQRGAASTARSTRHPAVRLKPRGVYLITGGLTGLGAAHAEHVARTVGARLVLVGRTPLQRGPLPVDDGGRHRGLGERAALVRRLESLGSEVLTVEADVSNRSDVRRVVETARARFGRIDGVFHAAGVLADSPLALKSSDQIERVFAPKAKGAILLDEALEGEALDFVVLFSSTSAEVGIPGQVDYSAASAFLNALAHDRWSRTQQPTMAIDWGVWQDIGLAARAAAGGASASEGSATRGGLSLETISATEAEVVREGHFRANESWILDGHRLVSGRAVLPGTATFALTIDTLQQLPAWSSMSRTLVFEDLRFLAPLLVEDEVPTRVRTSLSKTATGYEYRMSSEGTPNAWTDHVHARVSWRDPSRRSVDVADLRASFARLDEDADTLGAQRRHVRFGPEWSCAVALARHDAETLATLEAVVHDDVSPWGADPALLDVAMTSVLPLLGSDQDRLWVPRGCASVRIFGAIPRHLMSHSRLRPDADAASARADVTLVSLDGLVVAEFEGVELAAVTPARLERVERVSAATDAPRSAFAAMVAHGITRDEGLQALERVLAAPQPEVMVSSIGLDVLRRHVKLASEPSAGGGPRFARPSHVRSTFVGPSTPTEGRVLALWQDVLGIDGIGVHDNFFELGGDSLSGLRLFSQIRRVFDVNFPIDTLFTAPTIATCAALLDAEVAGPGRAGHLERSAPTNSSIVPIQTAGTRPPLYCVHEQNGYVLSYRELSHHLGDDQPFYGFQASGLDGTNEFDLTIEAMAARYVRALVVAQPDGPYYLAGSSLGGLVVYEMARQLHDMDREVALVALFDSWTPAALRPIRKVRQETNLEYLRRHVREFATLGARRYLQERFEKRRERLAAKMLKADMRARIAEHLSRNTEMPYELLQMHLETIYERAYLTYTVPPYAGTVTLYRAIDRWHRLDNEPALGWDRVKLGALDIHPAPGRHGFMVREPHVAQLAAMLRREIDKAWASSVAAVAPQAREASGR